MPGEFRQPPGYIPLSPKPTPWFAGPGVILSFLIGATAARCQDVELLRPSDRDRLLVYARDTWKSMAAMADGSELPADGLRHLPNGRWEPTPKTTPTDIGAYLWSTIAAERLGIITADESHRRLGRMPRFAPSAGAQPRLLLRRHRAQDGPDAARVALPPAKIEAFISSVDNGWLAAALMIVRNARPELRDRADGLLKAMDFGFFFKPFRPEESRQLARADARPLLARPRPVRRLRPGAQHRAADLELHRHRTGPGPADALLSHGPHPRTHRTPVARSPRGSGKPTSAFASSRVITGIAACGSSRAGAAACSRPSW